jgi:hypothetical protein
MAIYMGVSGVPKEVVGVYIKVNGAPKEVSEVYVGDSSKSPRLVYGGSSSSGETIFTKSGTFTVPKGVKKIDVFCVGGGGGGYYQASDYYQTQNTIGGVAYQCSFCGTASSLFVSSTLYYYDTVEREESDQCGCGGSITSQSISVTPGSSVSVTVGAGGGYSMYATGGNSSAGSVSATGGKGWYSNISGDEAYGKWYSGSVYLYWYSPTVGGYFGMCAYCKKSGTIISYWKTGSVITTYQDAKTYREAKAGGYAFGDTSRSLYGCGGGYRSAFANSGDGFWGYGYSGTNSSGIVIIKWGK